MASYRRRSGRIQVRWRDLAGAQRSHTVPNLRTARQVIREIEESLALGYDWAPVDLRAAPSLDEIFAAWLADRARLWRPRTHQQNAIAVRLFTAWLKRGARTRRLMAERLSREALLGFYDHMCGERENSALSAGQRVRMIHRAWRWAFDHDIYGDLVPRPRTIELPEATAELAPRAPTWALCDAVIHEASVSRAPWYGRFFTVMRFTGLRKMQVMRLRWADVDRAHALLTIRPELGKSRKERRGRVVPIAPHLMNTMAGWNTGSGFVIEKPGRTRRPDNETLRRFWIRAGMPAETLRQPCHAMRKALVSELTRRGVADRVIKALIGHTQGTTGDVYRDPVSLMPAMRAAVALMPPIGQAGRSSGAILPRGCP